ncbi:unnamed protein product [Lupinus luteus]|uniref:Uncharacterized protein n=1 Tax=Lupinus luteus TaxID=3873 RepID=A0AAV1X1B1_LUPLU
MKENASYLKETGHLAKQLKAAASRLTKPFSKGLVLCPSSLFTSLIMTHQSYAEYLEKHNQTSISKKKNKAKQVDDLRAQHVDDPRVEDLRAKLVDDVELPSTMLNEPTNNVESVRKKRRKSTRHFITKLSSAIQALSD